MRKLTTHAEAEVIDFTALKNFAARRGQLRAMTFKGPSPQLQRAGRL
ncbi:hypothetical protein AB0M19_11015 [Streptomyces sp. NPDC051920]